MDVPHLVGHHPLPEQQPLRPFLEKVIDKKVNEVALTIFEWLVDKLCSYFYPAYQKRLAFRLEESLIDEEDKISSEVQKVAEKVLHFTDGAPLFDRTTTQRVAITAPKLFNIITKETTVGHDQIEVDGKVVHFTKIPNTSLLFGKNYGTQHVVVADVKEFPELVMIYERETNNQIKAWCVDTTNPTKKITMAGQISLDEKEILMAQQIILQPAPQPLHVPLI